MKRHMKEDGWPTDKWTVAGGLLGSIERVQDPGKEKPRGVTSGVMIGWLKLVSGEGGDQHGKSEQKTEC